MSVSILAARSLLTILAGVLSEDDMSVATLLLLTLSGAYLVALRPLILLLKLGAASLLLALDYDGIVCGRDLTLIYGIATQKPLWLLIVFKSTLNQC